LKWPSRIARVFADILGGIYTVRYAKAGINVPPGYRKIGEVERLSELDGLKPHPLIESSEIEKAAGRLAVYRDGRLDFEETLRNVLEYVVENVKYDHIHADSSVNWRRIGYTYLTADEAYRLRTGICGEQSLVAVSILRTLGIPATLHRPYRSHIAVVAENPENPGEKVILDTVSKTMRRVKGRVPRFARKKYIIGPISLDEFNKQTLTVRRKTGNARAGQNLTATEALDLEYVDHCLEPPFNTDKGRGKLKKYLETGVCKRVSEDYGEALMVGGAIASCRRKHPLEDSEFIKCMEKEWIDIDRYREKTRKIRELYDKYNIWSEWYEMVG